VEESTLPSPEMTTARLLLAMRNADPDIITQALARTRMELGQPISAAGSRSYRRSYASTISLHIVREVELVCQTVKAMGEKGKDEESQRQFQSFVAVLDDRLQSALPSFRTLEPILSMRRTALNLV
jgi:serine/threonine-protein kinase ATR